MSLLNASLTWSSRNAESPNSSSQTGEHKEVARRIRPSPAVAATVLLPILVLGFASKPPLKQTGFLQDYIKLEPVDDNFHALHLTEAKDVFGLHR
jgi:hypothetical protein